ncbi:MAG: IclR family transcriptional regulator [Gaiellales bacterium]
MLKVEEGAQSIDRAAQILVQLVESDDAITLAGVMEETRLPKSTAARLLRALERNGLAQRRRGGGFRPGPVLVEYARRDTSVGDLATLAWPFLERLGQATGETANVAVPTPTGVARLAQVDSAHPLGAGNWDWVGRRIPIHASSMGKLFMAFGAAQPPTGRLAKLGPNTITTLADLLAELDEVRGQGYATTWEELEAGLCSTAAPVHGGRGSVIAAISVSAPTVRTTRERLAELSAMVVEEASALSEHIQQPQRGDRGA